MQTPWAVLLWEQEQGSKWWLVIRALTLHTDTPWNQLSLMSLSTQNNKSDRVKMHISKGNEHCPKDSSRQKDHFTLYVSQFGFHDMHFLWHCPRFSSLFFFQPMFVVSRVGSCSRDKLIAKVLRVQRKPLLAQGTDKVGCLKEAAGNTDFCTVRRRSQLLKVQLNYLLLLKSLGKSGISRPSVWWPKLLSGDFVPVGFSHVHQCCEWPKTLFPQESIHGSS